MMLATDAYKFAMAQAGFPLRQETFYLSFRRGGPHWIPPGLEPWIRGRAAAVAAAAADPDAQAFLRQHGYGLSEAMAVALGGGLTIRTLPPHTWALDREPILSVTGPSFLVSLLEPMLIWLHYPIQLATTAARYHQGIDPRAPEFGTATCEDHRLLIESTVGPILGTCPRVDVDPTGYADAVARRAAELVAAVGDAPDRIFEVGMRSAVCMEQHRIALRACRQAGVLRTSNVLLAAELGMIPVGTMGHEHVQRWGSDLRAFRAMRDMRSAPPSYLLDTFDTLGSGLPSALRALRERPCPGAVRYDSGDKEAQYRTACALFAEHELTPTHILEDGFDLEKTRRFEALRAETRVPAAQQIYGFGGYLVADPADSPHRRNLVSAVYKLSATSGEPRMKFGDADGGGKASIPGVPVVWRRVTDDGPVGMIAQDGEPVPDGYIRLTDATELPPTLPDYHRLAADPRTHLSPATRAHIASLDALRGN